MFKNKIFTDNGAGKTMIGWKTAIVTFAVFTMLLIWHAEANAIPLQHWANFRYAWGDLIGVLPAGEEVIVQGPAEDYGKSYVYVPSYGMYGYVCDVYIYGGTEWEYEHPFDYGKGSSYTYYEEDNYGYTYEGDYNTWYYEEENTYEYPKEDYVYSYVDDGYESSYDYLYDQYGWGATEVWVEVDIEDQTARLWNGRDVMAEDYCTTGMADTHPTPIGTYEIYDKVKHTVLEGWNDDGTTYTAKVEFWMPFNGGIGLHDATWRSEFGGDIYKTKGSHGCVNLPYYLAEAIWNSSVVNTMVSVHY